tara:strand:- start:855 stop:1223 length:369 start_codon:yes stop_codon:yes gene_type:complete
MDKITLPREAIKYMCVPGVLYFKDKCPGDTITFQREDILLLESERADVGRWLYDELCSLATEAYDNENPDEGYMYYKTRPDPVMAEHLVCSMSSKIPLGDGWYTPSELDFLWLAFEWLAEHI